MRVVHVGPSYTERPSRRPSDANTRIPGSFSTPHRRALTFDIDLTDYTYFNIEKSDLQACDDAWPLVAFAVSTVRRVLREAFGFEHFACFYSGRRGAHLWVLDERASRLSNEGRKGIFDFLTPCPKRPETLKKHPFLKKLVGKRSGSNSERETAVGFFESWAARSKAQGGAGILDTKSGVVQFVRRLKVEGDESGHYFWNLIDETMSFPPDKRVFHLKEHVSQKVARMPTLKGQSWMEMRYVSVVLEYVWPKLDQAVTTHVNHLVKSPFSIHGKTRRPAVFVPEGSLWTFSPRDVPCLPDDEKDARVETNLQAFSEFVNASSEALEEFLRLVPPAAPAMQDPCDSLHADITHDVEDAVAVPPPSLYPSSDPVPKPDTRLSTSHYGVLTRKFCVHAVPDPTHVRTIEHVVCMLWSKPSWDMRKESSWHEEMHGPFKVEEEDLFASEVHPPTRDIVDEILASEDKIRTMRPGRTATLLYERVVFPLHSESDLSFLSHVDKVTKVHTLSFSEKKADKTLERCRLLMRIKRNRTGAIYKTK